MVSNIKKRTLYGVLLALVVLVMSFRFFVDMRLDFLWFQSLGYITVFWRTYLWQGLVGLGIFGLVFFSSYLNLFIAFKRSGQKHFQLRNIALAIGISVIIWVEAGDVWFMVLQAINRTPFEVVDPHFGWNVSFFVFIVPFLKLIYRSLMTWLVLNLAAIVMIYVLSRGQKAQPDVEIETEVGSGRFRNIADFGQGVGLQGLQNWPGRGHASILLGMLLALQALYFGLNIADLMYAQGNLVSGASATDIRMYLPGNLIMAGFSLLAGLLFAFSSKQKIKNAAIILVSFFALNALFTGIFPSIYQQFIVSPNEISKETPYLERSIKYTNLAYGLDDIEEREYPVGELTLQELKDNQDVIDNIRLLDQRATLTTYGQQQELRPYYEFVDVDVDRYMIDGKQTQVMVAAREINQKELPTQAQSFNNLMFQYTHGFGLVMSPANRVTSTGLPDYFIKDIPPVSKGLEINQPRIYFGEQTENNVIVKTKLLEFDYTDGENNKEYYYEGTVGIPMTLGNRLLLAFRDVQYKYLFTSYITGDSLYLETRNVRERAARIAPFLYYDSDPYVVLTDDGNITYIIDAYTLSNRYPYSQAANEVGYNYIRNSVKVTVDAYTGEINFFNFDDADPIIKTYAKIYPDLIKERSEFPEELLAHIRYPEALFQVQSQMLKDYHMSNPVAFYNKEDRWAFASQILGNEKTEQDPYYTISRLPGEAREEFVLLRNFTPNGKQNMIAWLAGRSDGSNYGKLLLYTFSKGTQVPGPMQVESQIDQNPEISGQLSLWGQGGSTLIRGNLLVYPLGESLLYVEPLYMESVQNKFPQLKRVFLYYHDRIVMAESLTQALDAMFPGYAASLNESGQGQSPGSVVVPGAPGESPSGIAVPGSIESILVQVIEQQKAAKAALINGDWVAYGAAQAKLDQLLGQLEPFLQEQVNQP